MGPVNITLYPPGGDSGKEPAANAGDKRDVGSLGWEDPLARPASLVEAVSWLISLSFGSTFCKVENTVTFTES